MEMLIRSIALGNRMLFVRAVLKVDVSLAIESQIGASCAFGTRPSSAGTGHPTIVNVVGYFIVKEIN
jgi:hypothetical protein